MNQMNEKELRELDLWLCEHVFGWKWYSHVNQDVSLNRGERFLADPNYSPEFIEKYCQPADMSWPASPNEKYGRIAPNYTTDPAAAMEALERILEDHPLQEIIKFNDGQYHCSVTLMPGENHVEATAPTLELAICLLAKRIFETTTTKQ